MIQTVSEINSKYNFRDKLLFFSSPEFDSFVFNPVIPFFKYDIQIWFLQD